MLETKFAIMLPYYGSKALLQEAVESVLHQRQRDSWTLTILDDAYPDPAAGEWLSALEDPRVTYIRNKRNLGLAENFQQALEMSRGQYTIFLGSDDRMLPNYLESLTRLTKLSFGAEILQPGVRVIDDKGLVVRPLADRIKTLIRPPLTPGAELRILSGEPLAVSLMRGDWAYFPALAWKTSAIREIGFNTSMETALDLRLLVETICMGGRLALGREISFEYRRHASSVSSELARHGDRFREEEELFRLLEQKFVKMGWDKARRAAQWHLTSRAYQLISRIRWL
jgi:glycosyltransferase involved in cell wall biosynthesis